jgi:ABC-2 type transporter
MILKSGLDSSSTAVVVAALQRAAQQGLTVVCTIHQPSRSVFESFDNLLLLRKGGVCVYQGPISKISSYVEGIAPQLTTEKGDNPADNVLEVFCGNNDDAADWVQQYSSSYMFKDALESYEAGTSSPGEDVTALVSTLDACPWSVQLYYVLTRSLLAHWRTPSYMAIRLWWTVLSNLVVGLVFLGAGYDDSPNSAQNVLGALFFFVNVATVPLLSAVVPLITERAIFYRETFSGTYGKAAYGWAVQLAELPFNLSFAIVAWLVFYFTVGLTSQADRIVYFILMTLAAYWWIPATGQLLAFLSPNIGSAVGMGGLLLTVMQLTMGFLIPANAIPPWYIWGKSFLQNPVVVAA